MNEMGFSLCWFECTTTKQNMKQHKEQLFTDYKLECEMNK